MFRLLVGLFLVLIAANSFADSTSGKLIEVKCETRLRENNQKFVFGSILVFRKNGSQSVFETFLIRSSTNGFHYKEAINFCNRLRSELGNEFTYTYTNNHLDFSQNILVKVKARAGREFRITQLPNQRKYNWPVEREDTVEFVGRNRKEDTCSVRISKGEMRSKVEILNHKNKVEYEQTFTNAQIDESIYKEIIPNLARYRFNPSSDALFFKVSCLNATPELIRNCYKVDFPYNGDSEKHRRIEVRYDINDFTKLQTVRVFKKKGSKQKIEHICKLQY